MNRKEFVRGITSYLRNNNLRKAVSLPKQIFHISDNEGNTKDFIVRKTDKTVLYTVEDIEAIIDAFINVISDALKRGESISIRGFGTFGLKYRKPRATKKLGTNEWIDIDARYVPKFSFGNDLRMCAKLYELSLEDKSLKEPLPVFSDSDTGGGG